MARDYGSPLARLRPFLRIVGPMLLVGAIVAIVLPDFYGAKFGFTTRFLTLGIFGLGSICDAVRVSRRRPV